MVHDTPTVILFVTNSESGQANTILALVAELLSRPDTEVHVASFAALEKRVAALRNNVLSQPSSSSLTFHTIHGVDMNTALRQRGIRDEDLIHSPTTKSYKAYDIASSIVTAWSCEDYLQIVQNCTDIIRTTDPDMSVIDYLFNPARDAATCLDIPYILSNPSSALDVIGTDHPRLKFFWYYPAFGSGLPFPIPLRKIWKNIKMKLRMLYSYLTAREISALVKYRNSHGIFGRLPHETPLRKATEVISPDIVDLDFPFKQPSNLRLYGPIVLDGLPVRDLDPQLSDWLDAGPTVLMSMGTHFTYTRAQVRAVLRGFLIALDQKTRVLWKLPRDSSFNDIIDELLPGIEDKERFKIVDWIPVDPFSIMTHRNVMAFVHHGGANSYFEAALAALPQVILAQWYDLYDNATRAEYRRIGIYGNKGVAPDIDADEFAAALRRVAGPGREAEDYRTRALEVSGLCRAAGGRRAAVDRILELSTQHQRKIRDS